MLTQTEFDALVAEGYTRIPIVRELLSLASDRLRPCTRVDRLVRDHGHLRQCVV